MLALLKIVTDRASSISKEIASSVTARQRSSPCLLPLMQLNACYPGASPRHLSASAWCLGSRTSEMPSTLLGRRGGEGEKLRLLFFLFYHPLWVKQRTNKGDKNKFLDIGSLSPECKPTASLVAFRDLRGLGGLKNKNKTNTREERRMTRNNRENQ